MKQSLSLNLKQKLLMTPRLQQSINILQLSSYELNELIEKEYLENPTLEMESGSENEPDNTYDFDKTIEFLEYLNKDDEKPEPMAADDDYKVKEPTQNYQSLEEVLAEQLDFVFKNKQDLKIAKYIIALLDKNGYLRTQPTEIAQLLKVDLSKIEAVIKKVQTLEPTGVGAQNLEECLMLQAKKANIYNGLIKLIIDKYLNLVAQNKLKEIANLEKSTPEKVQQAIDIIRKFNPKPGACFGKSNPEYVIPDVAVKDINGRLEVILNEKNTPKLYVNKLYQKYHTVDEHSQKYIEHHVNSAIWLIKSIEQRRTTLLNVVTEIVHQQEDVFRKGLSFMKPLLMKTIAENIGVHESTVSRTVANKYVEMPYGIVPLKKFFSANIAKPSSQNCFGEKSQQEAMIADTVKNEIRQLIEQENKQKPYSDQQLSDLLKTKNIKISRRTVMKYREQLGFASSSKRKRY